MIGSFQGWDLTEWYSQTNYLLLMNDRHIKVKRPFRNYGTVVTR